MNSEQPSPYIKDSPIEVMCAVHSVQRQLHVHMHFDRHRETAKRLCSHPRSTLPENVVPTPSAQTNTKIDLIESKILESTGVLFLDSSSLRHSPLAEAD